MAEAPQAVDHDPSYDDPSDEAASDPESSDGDAGEGDNGMAEESRVVDAVEAASDPENSDGDADENGDEHDDERSDDDPVNAPTLRLGDPDSQEMPPLSDDMEEDGDNDGEGSEEDGSEKDGSDDEVVVDDYENTGKVGLVDPQFHDPSKNELFEVPSSGKKVIEDRNKVTELCMDLMKYWKTHDPAILTTLSCSEPYFNVQRTTALPFFSTVTSGKI